MKHEDLKRMIMEELNKVREAAHEFPSEGLTVEALDDGDQPVVSTVSYTHLTLPTTPYV